MLFKHKYQTGPKALLDPNPASDWEDGKIWKNGKIENREMIKKWKGWKDFRFFYLCLYRMIDNIFVWLNRDIFFLSFKPMTSALNNSSLLLD